MSRILFASSEATPLIKTGGLADISGSLPAALKAIRQAVRLVLPAYPEALRNAGRTKKVATLTVGGHTIQLLEGRMPDSQVVVWLVDSPEHFAREGRPYTDDYGHDWPDNAERFACNFINNIKGMMLKTKIQQDHIRFCLCDNNEEIFRSDFSFDQFERLFFCYRFSGCFDNGWVL